MVEIPTSTRNSPVGLNRSPLRTDAASATLATPAGESSNGVSGTARLVQQRPAHLSMSTLGGFKSAMLEFRHAAATLAALAKVLVLKSPFTAVAPEAGDPPMPGATRSSTHPDAPNSDPRSLHRPTAALSGSALTTAPTTTTLLRAVQAFVAAHNELSATLHRLTDAADAGETAPDHRPAASAALTPGRAGVAPAAMSRTVPVNTVVSAGEAARIAQSAGGADRHAGGLGGIGDREATPDTPGPSVQKLLDGLTATVSRRSDWSAIGLTLDRAGGLRLNAGQLQAALAAAPRTVAGLFSELGAAADEASLSPSPLRATPRASGPATAVLPAPPLTVLAEFREKVQVLTRLARLLADPAPPAGSLPARGSANLPASATPGQNVPTATRPALPALTASQANPGVLPTTAPSRPALPTLTAGQATPGVLATTAPTPSRPALSAITASQATPGVLATTAPAPNRPALPALTASQANPGVLPTTAPSRPALPTLTAGQATPGVLPTTAPSRPALPTLTAGQATPGVLATTAPTSSRPALPALTTSQANPGVLATAAPTSSRPALPTLTAGQATPGVLATAASVLPASATIRSTILNPDGDSTALETVYLHHRETLLSTALPRPEVRLAALTLQLQAGRHDAVTGRFVADPQPATQVISGDGDTLARLRDAISAGDPELGVAVIKDGTGYRLAVRLPEEATTRTVAVNLGKTPVSATPDDGQPLGFTVQRDADAVQKAVQSLVSAYNRLGSAAGSITGDVPAQTPIDPLRQALAGAMTHPERIRTLAQAGITVQPDGSLLIDPVRLRQAAEAHPRRLLDPFTDLDVDDPEEDRQPSASTDASVDRLADLGDEPESWSRLLEDPTRQPALNPDDGQRANSGLDVVAARCLARLQTVDQVRQQIWSSATRLQQVLAQWAGESAASIESR